MSLEHSPARQFLTRKQAATFLTEAGFPTSFAVLNKLSMPTVGKGPEIALWWGPRALYTEESLLAWARSRCRRNRPGTGGEAA